jgi:hypothetical protein
MLTIETTAIIADDRRLVLQLPQDVPAGEHHVVVLLDQQAVAQAPATETPVRWEDGLLVYAGDAAAPLENAIEELRDERIRNVLSA